jgi:hypothetical protein
VQLIAHKLIAPALGATVLTCAVAVTGAAPTNGATARTPHAAGASGPTGPTPGAVVTSEVEMRNVLLDHPVTVTGVVQSTTGLETVMLEQRVRHGWHVVARTRNVAGTFTLSFRPRGLGRHALRLDVAGAAAVPIAGVDVFHRVLASWYGPGGETACGEALTASTLGVANRTLPCGTPVTLRYHDRTLRVRVIDRGPYVAGRDYDLTYATKLALHASDLTEVWANQ